MAEDWTEHRTKQALDAALRDCLRQKPLEQIRVRELTDRCGIRRQSFYYHFPDVYALFAWTMERERQTLRRRQNGFFTWRQVLRDLLDRLNREAVYYQAVLDAKGREGLEQVLGPAVEDLLAKLLTYYHCRCTPPPQSGTAPDTASLPLLAEGYAKLLLPLLEHQIGGNTGQSPEALLDLLEDIVHKSTLGAAWQAAPRVAGTMEY